MTLLVGLVSCANLPPLGGQGRPLLEVPLQPDRLGRSLTLSQIVEGEYGDERHSMRMEVEVTPDRLVMVGLSHLGVPLFSLEQKAGEPTIETRTAEQFPVDPGHLVSDLQLVYWPASALAEALEPKEFRLSDGRRGGYRQVVDRAGKVVVEILYPTEGDDADIITVQHFDHPYRLKIKTLRAQVQK